MPRARSASPRHSSHSVRQPLSASLQLQDRGQCLAPLLQGPPPLTLTAPPRPVSCALSPCPTDTDNQACPLGAWSPCRPGAKRHVTGTLTKTCTEPQLHSKLQARHQTEEETGSLRCCPQDLGIRSRSLPAVHWFLGPENARQEVPAHPYGEGFQRQRSEPSLNSQRLPTFTTRRAQKPLSRGCRYVLLMA